MQDTSQTDGSAPRAGEVIANLGQPISLIDMNMAGVVAQVPGKGEAVSVWTRLLITSDDKLFHKIVQGVASAIEESAKLAGAHVRLDQAGTVFMVVRPDNTGELWLDTAAMNIYVAIKRPGRIGPGEAIFENDLADVSGLWFPLVKVGPKDKVLCILRVGWRFSLFFDFNPKGELSIDAATRDLGSLYRRMRYAEVYTALADEPTLHRLLAAGWFPFLELMKGEFRTLLDAQDAGVPLDRPEAALVEMFDDARVDRIFDRWMERSELKSKEKILSAAINAFKAREPVAVVKIVLSEIEGVMSEAYFRSKGERTHRIQNLLEFMISCAEQRAGGKDTLFFPVEFGRYLKDYTYAGFGPGDVGKAGSRHAVGHGAVAGDQYTVTRALQAILTLDQLAFYV